MGEVFSGTAKELREVQLRRPGWDFKRILWTKESWERAFSYHQSNSLLAFLEFENDSMTSIGTFPSWDDWKAWRILTFGRFQHVQGVQARLLPVVSLEHGIASFWRSQMKRNKALALLYRQTAATWGWVAEIPKDRGPAFEGFRHLFACEQSAEFLESSSSSWTQKGKTPQNHQKNTKKTPKNTKNHQQNTQKPPKNTQ